MRGPIRNIVISAIAALTLPLTAAGQGVATWLETEHDFGAFRETERQVSCRMRLVNTGDSAMMITRVQPTCGCTASHYDEGIIMPGDTASVELTYSAVARPGQFEKAVFVYTNGTPRKSVLTIKGTVIASPLTVNELYPVAVGDIHLETAIIPVGEIVRGRTKMIYVTAYNASTAPMHITATTDSKNVIPHAVPDTIMPGERGSVTIFYDSKYEPEWGLNTHKINVSATGIGNNEAVSGENTLELMAVVVDDFDEAGKNIGEEAPTILTSTERLNFDTIDGNKPVSLTFKVKNTGKRKLELRRLTCPDEGVSVKCNKTSLKHGKTATVTVTVNPMKFSDKLINTSINILSNDPQNHNVAVRVVGLIK